MNIFQKILGTASLTLIGYLAEDALSQASSDSEFQALTGIIETNELDEAYALCHEQLGNQEEADHLRLWMNARQNRAVRTQFRELLAA